MHFISNWSFNKKNLMIKYYNMTWTKEMKINVLAYWGNS